MKKFLSLVLSFSLISGSFAPAYSQLLPVRPLIAPTITRQISREAVQFLPLKLSTYHTALPVLREQLPTIWNDFVTATSVIKNIPTNVSLPNLLSDTETLMFRNSAAAGIARMAEIGLLDNQQGILTLAQQAGAFSKSCFAPVFDMVMGRVLARNGMYDELNTLILEKKPTGQFWLDLKDICNERGAHITAPIGAEENSELEAALPSLQDYLKEEYGDAVAFVGGNFSGEFSRKSTLLYLSMGTDRYAETLQAIFPPTEASQTITAQIEKRATTSVEEQAEIAPLSLGQYMLPDMTGNGGHFNDGAEQLAQQSTQTTLPSAQVTSKESPRTIKEKFIEGVGSVADKARSLFSLSSADKKQAQMVLSKPQPLSTHLRDIVFGDASAVLKMQALLKIYERGILNDFLAAQPANVKDKVINAKTEAQRARALYRLYQSGYLDESLNAITDVQTQGSILEKVEEVTSGEGFNEAARSVYAVQDKIPVTGSNYNGVVPSVPEADKEVIAGVVRPAGYAQSNASSGVASKKGTFYANNIPFYYRNSKGELSSEPVGILTQVPASLYGRILSFMHLASQPGLTIPEGFVLALDEKGHWKFFTPKGNLAIVKANPHSRKVLEEIDKKGSYRVQLDTNYSTTDLLAMARLLEANPSTLNLELSLNTPHSLKQFLAAHAFFVGNDAGNTLTGPFKESLKTSAQGVVNMVTNLLGGIGYMTPIAGGYAMPTMSRWGNAKTTKVIYGSAAAALAYSVFGLGMYGTVDPTSLPLAALAVPTVALVLGASLANSFIPTFLSFYKDPAARTAANLDFSTKKQISRLALSGVIAGAAMADINWTIVAPIGLGLLGISYALFRNTPMYREAGQMPKKKAEEKVKDPNEGTYVQEYRDFRDNLPEMKAIKSRVKMVYASYAASLMILGQSANAVLPGGWGQGFITACMLATLGVRMTATKLVKKNIMTDDQLTGLSLPTLALSGAALALLPFSGPLALLAGTAGILHYMATAVPGQLDAARMQNIVTAEMQQRKQKVLDDASLTKEQKEASVKRLEAEEKVWSAQASKDYSLYNSRGLWGIGVAAAAAFLFEDLGPQWTKDLLETISNFYGDGANPSLALDRLLFGYSAGVAGILAMKNLHLTRDGLSFFTKKKPVTAERIQAGEVMPKEFGINEKNAHIQLGDITGKRIKELEKQIMGGGVDSEQNMTAILTQLQAIHNRLVAISQVAGEDATRAAFQREAGILTKVEGIMNQSQNDFSSMFVDEFKKMQDALLADGVVRQAPSYVEENIYKLPESFNLYLEASRSLAEMNQMAYTLQSGGVIDYKQFVNYMDDVQSYLLTYEKANRADSPRVRQLRSQYDEICSKVAVLDRQTDETGNRLLDISPADTPYNKEGKQALRDMLRGY